MSGASEHLMQDECKGLGKWFASRIDARENLRKVLEMEMQNETQWTLAMQLEKDLYADGITNKLTGAVGVRVELAVRPMATTTRGPT